MKQQGLALLTVIFLLVVLSAAMVSLSTLTVNSLQQQGKALLVAKAENAAHSGLEYGVYQLVNGATCASLNSATLSSSLDAASENVFTGFSIVLSCAQRDYDNSVVLYDLAATASYGGSPDSPDYVWRKLTAVIEL